MRNTRIFYILFLLCLPVFVNAQQSVPPNVWDSMVTEDLLTTAAKREAAEEVADSVARRIREQPVVVEHFLWDRAVPALSDTMETYADYPLVIRAVSDSIKKTILSDKELQYVLKAPETEPGSSIPGEIFTALAGLIRAFPFAIVCIVLLSAGVLIYIYLRKHGYLFRQTKADTDNAVKHVDEEADTATYQRQIEAAISSGKLRLAVRFLYLQTLRVLVDKGIIIYSREATNAAYLRSMTSTPWYKTFAALTLDYEYIWYGEVSVNEEQFNVIHGRFRQFMNELGYTR